MAACTDGEITQSLSTVVRHGVVFQIAPDAFDRVHLWCVGGQELQRDCPTLSFHVYLAGPKCQGRGMVLSDKQAFVADWSGNMDSGCAPSWPRACDMLHSRVLVPYKGAEVHQTKAGLGFLSVALVLEVVAAMKSHNINAPIISSLDAEFTGPFVQCHQSALGIYWSGAGILASRVRQLADQSRAYPDMDRT